MPGHRRVQAGQGDPGGAAVHALAERGEPDGRRGQGVGERGETPADSAAAEFVPAQLIGVMRVRPLPDGKPADCDYLLRFLDAAVFPALGLS